MVTYTKKGNGDEIEKEIKSTAFFSHWNVVTCISGVFRY